MMKIVSRENELVIGELKNSTISPTAHVFASRLLHVTRGAFYFRLAVAQTKRYSYTASGGGALQNPSPFSKQAMRGDDRLTCCREGGSISTIDHPSLVDLNDAGGDVARINVDDELKSDPRFTALCLLIPRHEAYGSLICLWEVGQSYWKKGEELIPEAIFRLLPNWSHLLSVGFVKISEDGVYCLGASERWGFLLQRAASGRLGGVASARSRRIKYGSAIPNNATNAEAQTEAVPEATAEQKTEANRSKPKPSSSSSSSSSVISTLNKYNPYSPLETEQGFSSFWKLYPRKVAKPNALKSFSRLNPQPEVLDQILADVAARKATDDWKRDNGKFIPYPATYLNQRRWEDQVVEVKTWQDEVREHAMRKESK